MSSSFEARLDAANLSATARLHRFAKDGKVSSLSTSDAGLDNFARDIPEEILIMIRELKHQVLYK